jgi:hypothetical protein
MNRHPDTAPPAPAARPARSAQWHRNAALVAPLLLVNTAAIYGQSGWAFDHLGHNWIVAVLFALAVESIGVFLAAEAHAALMAGHASGALRLGSYAVGALVGCLNFAHYAAQPGYRPNPLAVTFGLLSSISPWLWAIRSRSLNRDRLAEMGLVDPRAVKFSRLRWALFPLRTFAAFRAAVWAGITRPDAAVAAADLRRADRRPVRHAAPPALPAEPARAIEPAPEGTGTPTPAAKPTAEPAADPAPASKQVRPGRPRSTRRPPSAAKVAKAAARMPGATVAQIAAKAGVSEATVRRHLRAAANAAADATKEVSAQSSVESSAGAVVASPTRLRPAETPAETSGEAAA